MIVLSVRSLSRSLVMIRMQIHGITARLAIVLSFLWTGMQASLVRGQEDSAGTLPGAISTPMWLEATRPNAGRDAKSLDPEGTMQAVPLDEEPVEGFELTDEIDPGSLKTIDGFAGGVCIGENCVPRSRRYSVYRQAEGIFSYMPGDGDQFGWIDFEDTPYNRRNEKSGFTGGLGLHLLSGPNSVALPPRLWDFILGYQTRNTLSDRFSYDLGATVGVYSDFEDSARDGVRYPGHAVGILHVNDSLDAVLGVDYLDRDDYKILPVVGYSWHSDDFPNLNVDLIFPRPRVDYALSGSDRLYIGGLLGGGTWDIEMPGDVNDVMTYRDFRLLFGLEQLDEDGSLSSFELGYVFGRQVEFRSLQPTQDFDDAFIVRWVHRR